METKGRGEKHEQTLDVSIGRVHVINSLKHVPAVSFAFHC